MFERNRKPIKWSWTELGVNVVRPEMVAEPVRVLKWLSFPDADSIDIRFYPTMGLAIAIVYGCSEPFHVSLNMIRDANLHSGWDVEIVSNVEFEELNRTARQKFVKIDGMTNEIATLLIENGYLGYWDLGVVDPDWLVKNTKLTLEAANQIIDEADRLGEEFGDDPIGGTFDPL